MSTTLWERARRTPPVAQDAFTDESPVQWWARPHSWTFAGLVLVNVTVTWPLLRLLLLLQNSSASGLWMEAAQCCMIGVCLGQLYLASIWLAFGGLATLLRFAVVFLAVVAGAVNAALGITFEPWGMELTICLGASFLIVLLSQLVLAPVRWLTDWRIDFDAAYHSAESGRRMQLRLWHYLALTFLATLPLVVYRAIDAMAPTDDARDLATSSALLAAMTVLLAAPLTWLILAKRRTAIAWLSQPLGLVLAATLGYAATVTMTSEAGRSTSALVFVFAMPLGALLPVALNLVLLRMAGLHLLSVKRLQSDPFL